MSWFPTPAPNNVPLLDYDIYLHHWRSSHYAVTRVRNEKITQLREVVNDFPYRNALHLKKRIRSLARFGSKFFSLREVPLLKIGRS